MTLISIWLAVSQELFFRGYFQPVSEIFFGAGIGILYSVVLFIIFKSPNIWNIKETKARVFAILFIVPATLIFALLFHLSWTVSSTIACYAIYEILSNILQT